MAEGGDLSSIRHGSDADIDFTCTPCGEDDIREEAVKYCPQCQEYLCTTCTKHHGRQKATRSHKLISTADGKRSSTVTMTAKCLYHPDRDIEMYCGAHDMVYCAKCIATEHRACDLVANLEELHNFGTLQTDIQHAQDEVTNIHQLLITKCEEKQKNINSLEEQTSEIQKKIQDNGRILKEHIDKLTDKNSDTLNKLFTDVKNQLESDVNVLNDTIKELDKSKSDIQKVASSVDVTQQFVHLKLIQNFISQAKTGRTESMRKGIQTLDFTENIGLRETITKAEDLGRVVVKGDVPVQYKVKSMKNINVKMNEDIETCLITDICQLQDGTIFLTDWFNQKLKRLDGNYNVRDHCDLYNYPAAMCCTGQNEVAVKLRNNKVQFIAVGTTLSKLRHISIVGGSKWGMVYCEGDLWVSTGEGVNVYSTNGKHLRTIENDVNGQRIFKRLTQHMATSDNTVIVTDNSDGAVCLGKDGTVRKEFRDQRLKNASGVCVSSDSTVFVSGQSSYNILMFSSDGKCLGDLLTREDGVECPGALLYDIYNNCIIVTCLAFSDYIHILEMSD